MNTNTQQITGYGLFTDGKETPTSAQCRVSTLATEKTQTKPPLLSVAHSILVHWEKGRYSNVAPSYAVSQTSLSALPGEQAHIESTDNGMLYREMLGQWQHMPEYYCCATGKSKVFGSFFIPKIFLNN